MSTQRNALTRYSTKTPDPWQLLLLPYEVGHGSHNTVRWISIKTDVWTLSPKTTQEISQEVDKDIQRSFRWSPESIPMHLWYQLSPKWNGSHSYSDNHKLTQACWHMHMCTKANMNTTSTHLYQLEWKLRYTSNCTSDSDLSRFKG